MLAEYWPESILINKYGPLGTKAEVTFLPESIQGNPKCCNKAGHRKGMEEMGTVGREKKKIPLASLPWKFEHRKTWNSSSWLTRRVFTDLLLQAGDEILLKYKGKVQKWQQKFVSLMINFLKVADDVLTPEFAVCNERNTWKSCKKSCFCTRKKQGNEGLEFHDHNSYSS